MGDPLPLEIAGILSGPGAYGRTDSGAGIGKLLSAAESRSLAGVYSTSQVDSALGLKADLVGGVIPTAQIPAIAITEYLGSVASQVAMLALVGDRGDWCLRSDLGTTWVLADDDSSLLASWVQLSYPTAPVTSVAGRTGAVTLANTDISGLGSLATQSGTFSGTSSGTNTGDQNVFTTIAVSGQSNVVSDAASDTLTLVAGTNITITTDASTDTITITASGGGLSGTGSTDNAVLRADGVGGATLQASAIVIDDLYTASPNNTVNAVCLKPTGGTTNVMLAAVPKGTGAFCLAIPDSAVAGGNVRGANAIDLQTTRGAATQVASGAASIVIGMSNLANQSNAVAIGNSSSATGIPSYAFGGTAAASGNHSIAIGRNPIASGVNATAIGGYVTASGDYAIALGSQGLASKYGQFVHAANIFAAQGDCQFSRHIARKVTTDATPATLMLDGSAARLTITAGKIYLAEIQIVGIKSDGSAACCYQRKVAIKNVGGTTALVGTVETIGTDIEDAAGCDVTITADNTNDALDISVTGIAAETWRWAAIVQGIELAYGT